MTKSTIALKEYLDKLDLATDRDFLREAVQMLSQKIIEEEAEAQIGAKNLKEMSKEKPNEMDIEKENGKLV